MRQLKLLFFFFAGFFFSCKGQVPENRPHVKSPEFDEKISQTISFTVPTISVEDLKAMTNVVILDAREKEEFIVSHIPNARYVGHKKFSLKSIQDLPKDTTIVLYCSIGYRSEKVGDELIKKGYENINNLYGSVFEWVNQENELIDKNGNPTKKIHTYNKNWSKWVNGEKVEKIW